MFLKKQCSMFLVFCMLVAGFSSVSAVPVFAEDIVVIVNAANDVSDLSLSDLKSIYLMKKKKWSNGRKIMAWLPPSQGDEMKSLLTNAVKINDEADLKKYYLTAIFQQQITAIPASTLDSKDAAGKVAGDEGGLAIVKESEILGIPGIKIVRVGGL